MSVLFIVDVTPQYNERCITFTTSLLAPFASYLQIEVPRYSYFSIFSFGYHAQQK